MKIGIAGCTGRVGALLVEELRSGAWPGLELAAGSVRAGKALPKSNFLVTDDPQTLFKSSDLVIDFTTPDLTSVHTALAATYAKKLVVGTTGLTPALEKALQQAAEKTAILYAPNMSVGVNILLALVEQATAKLGPDWDIGIFEAHHKHKKDAPSGTALALGKVAGRDDIQYAVHRGGDVAGEHRVNFYAAGERVELSHIATDRGIFARGALRAALWLGPQKPGLYSMRDVLGLQ